MKIKQIFLMCMGVISFLAGDVRAAGAPGGPIISQGIPTAPAITPPAPAVRPGLTPIPTVQTSDVPSQITVNNSFKDIKNWAIKMAVRGDGQWLERNLNVIADKMKLEVRRDKELSEKIAKDRNELITAIRNLRGNLRLGTELSMRLADKTVSLELKNTGASRTEVVEEVIIEPDPVEAITETPTVRITGSDTDAVSRILKVAIKIAELEHALPKLKSTIQGYDKKLKASNNPDEKSVYALQILFKVVKPPLVNSMYLLNELLKVVTTSTVMKKLGTEGQGRMMQLAQITAMGYRYSKDMAETLTVLTQSLSARDKARKAAMRNAAAAKLDDLDIDDILRDADVEERKFEIVQKDVEATVDEFAPAPETELLKVLRAMSRLVGHKKQGKLEAEIIALRDEMRAAPVEEKAEPALKMLFKMSQPLTDATYILSRVVAFLARLPYVGQGFKDISSVTTDIHQYTKVIDTALEDLAKSLQAQEQF